MFTVSRRWICNSPERLRASFAVLKVTPIESMEARLRLPSNANLFRDQLTFPCKGHQRASLIRCRQFKFRKSSVGRTSAANSCSRTKLWSGKSCLGTLGALRKQHAMVRLLVLGEATPFRLCVGGHDSHQTFLFLWQHATLQDFHINFFSFSNFFIYLIKIPKKL